MEKVAFISGGVFIYWSSIILTLAVVTAIALFIAVYMGKSKNVIGAFAAVPAALILSVLLSRLIHWYCRADAYESMESAMVNLGEGGFALMGAFAGCILTACLLRLLRIVKNLPQMLDSMAIAGGTGIAVGRLASLFNSSDRGVLVPEHWGLPFAYPVTNAVSGVVENRLATFMLQSVFTGLLVLALLIYLLWSRREKKSVPDGDIALLFLSAYGGSQVLLDSTRYDSLFMRSNGFISIVQILGVVALVLALVVFSVRMVRSRGLKPTCFALWIGFAAALGIACYMEYHVQRHGDQAVFAYSIMGAAIAVMILVTLLVRGRSSRKTVVEEEVPPAAEKKVRKEKKIRAEKQPRAKKQPRRETQDAGENQAIEEQRPVEEKQPAEKKLPRWDKRLREEKAPEVPAEKDTVPAAPVTNKVSDSDEKSWEDQWTEALAAPSENDDSWLRDLINMEKKWVIEQEEQEALPAAPAQPKTEDDDDWEDDWTEPEKEAEEEWILRLEDLDYFKK